MKRSLLILLAAGFGTLANYAQDDDIYFVPSQDSETAEVNSSYNYDDGSSYTDIDESESFSDYDNWAEGRTDYRDVDEYNRRGNTKFYSEYSAVDTTKTGDDVYDDDFDETCTSRLVRFHSPRIGVYVSSPYYGYYGCFDPWYDWYDPWYYGGWYGYRWYRPWGWYSSWYGWGRPYYGWYGYRGRPYAGYRGRGGYRGGYTGPRSGWGRGNGRTYRGGFAGRREALNGSRPGNPSSRMSGRPLTRQSTPATPSNRGFGSQRTSPSRSYSSPSRSSGSFSSGRSGGFSGGGRSGGFGGGGGRSMGGHGGRR